MNARGFISLFFLCFHLTVSAQVSSGQHAVDSLKARMLVQKDSALANTLNALCTQYKTMGSYDSVEVYANLELQISTACRYKRGSGNATNSLAMNSRARGNYPKAKELTQEALTIRQEVYDSTGSIDDLRNLSASFNNLGLVDYNMGDYAESMKYNNKAKSIRETIYASTKNPKDNMLVAQTSNNMGIVYFDLGNYPEALRCYLAAERIFSDVGDKNGMGLTKSNIGNIYLRQRNIPDALKTEQEALAVYTDLGSRKDMAQVYSNIGNIYHAMHDTANAMRNYEKTFAIRKDMKDERGIAVCYAYIANIELDKQNYEAALKDYEFSLAINRKQKDKNTISLNLINEGILYFMMKDYKRSREVSQEGLDIALSNQMMENAMLAYSNFTKTDSALGDYKSAFNDYSRFLIYRDSLMNENKSRELVTEQMNYQFEDISAQEQADREKINAVAAAEKNRKQVQLYLMSGVLGIILLFAFFIYRNFKRKQKANEEIREQKKIIEQKQKSIVDSIRYAKRIQQSLLPTEKYIAKHLKK